jgi:hypothetical protein
MAGQRFKAENGILVIGPGSNSIFEHDVNINANLTVNGTVLLVSGDLIISGNLTYTNTAIAGDLAPVTSGSDLGNTTNRFDSFLANVNINGYLNPSANNIQAGNSISRWYVYSTDINASGNVAIGGSETITGNLTVNGAVVINNTVASGNSTVTGFINVSSYSQVGGNLAVTGTSTFTGNAVFSSNVTAKATILDNIAFFSNTKSVTTTSQTIVDSFPKTYGFFSKIIISVNNANTQLHAAEMLLLHDGTNVLKTQYGELYNTSQGTFDAAINNANVEIYFTAAQANTYTVKTLRQQFLT